MKCSSRRQASERLHRPAAIFQMRPPPAEMERSAKIDTKGVDGRCANVASRFREAGRRSLGRPECSLEQRLKCSNGGPNVITSLPSGAVPTPGQWFHLLTTTPQ